MQYTVEYYLLPLGNFRLNTLNWLSIIERLTALKVFKKEIIMFLDYNFNLIIFVAGLTTVLILLTLILMLISKVKVTTRYRKLISLGLQFASEKSYRKAENTFYSAAVLYNNKNNKEALSRLFDVKKLQFDLLEKQLQTERQNLNLKQDNYKSLWSDYNISEQERTSLKDKIRSLKKELRKGRGNELNQESLIQELQFTIDALTAEKEIEIAAAKQLNKLDETFNIASSGLSENAQRESLKGTVNILMDYESLELSNDVNIFNEMPPVYTTSEAGHIGTEEEDVDPSESIRPEIARIGYKPVNILPQNKDWTYPLIQIPKPNSIVRTPRLFKSLARGFKEEAFQKELLQHFKEILISGNHSIATSNGTRPYEPDISIVDIFNGLNLFIDIEIDEPYAGVTRKALHLQNEDDLRDCFFTDRGWIVIRFTEKQVHEESINCISLIAAVIKSQNTSFNFPESLVKVGFPVAITQWDLLQAQKWEGQRYREKYLNHSFSDVLPDKKPCNWILNKIELQQESFVDHTSLLQNPAEEVSIFEQCIHPRDSRIKFFDEEHIYLVDGLKAEPVSNFVSRFFEEFDAPYWSAQKAASMGMTPTELALFWSQKGKLAASEGTFLHKQIENHIADRDYEESIEFNYYLNFMNDHSEVVRPFRTEWRIFDEKLMVAGTLDLLSDNGDGTFDIYDWKRSKKIIDSTGRLINKVYRNGIGPLSEIGDTTYNHYVIQQNIYCWILETNYKIKINSMFLVVLYPELTKYHKVEVARVSPELIENLLTPEH